MWAIWLETREHIGLKTDFYTVNTPGAFEAGVLKAIVDRDAEVAICHARGWLMDEPFSIKPAMTGSFYCATHLGTYDTAIAFADLGLRANPNDRGLLNNKLVSLASIGKTDEAREILRHLARYKYDSEFRANYLAAEGIISFREGHISDGRSYYAQAIQTANDVDRPEKAFLACAYWIEQEAVASVYDESYFDDVIELVDSEIMRAGTKLQDMLVFTWDAMKARIRDKVKQQAFEPIVSDRNDGELLKASIVA